MCMPSYTGDAPTPVRADKKRWEDREAYDMMEPAWLAAFHRDDREG